MMTLKSLTLAALLALPLAAQAEVRDASVAMQVAPAVDLNRYLGTWYEIARFPNKFERGCTNVTATYAMRDDGDISVANACTKGGTTEVIEGKAWVVDTAKLKVTFVPWLGNIAAGDYWILDLKSNYSMAVVGAPKGDFGWILARKPTLSKADTDRALGVFAANGYDTTQLEWVQH
jgi:apolipoprotein D and lipocalin family protein